MTGDHCQTDIDECMLVNVCNHGGTCTNSPGSYSCNCSSGWTGERCLIDMAPKCNHTCSLDAVILSKPVTYSNATTCQGNARAPNEELPMACCSLRTSADWQKVNQVQDGGVCIDGLIPNYTPIAAFSITSRINDTAGIFYGCIKNGAPGFMMIRQDCSALPNLLKIESSSRPDPDSFYVIY